MSLKEIVLKNSTGNRQADEVLCGTISILEIVFAGRVKAYYLFGSFVDASSRATSDLDLCLVPTGRFTSEEHEKLQHIKWACLQISPIMIDMLALDEELLLQEGHFRIKSASRLLWGEDLRASMPEQSLEQYLHTYTQAPVTYMAQVLRHAESLTFPLSYPDPTGAFYGYDQPFLPPKGEVKRNIKGLVASVCWAASIQVTWHTGKTVASKSESVKRYREEVHDEWTPLLEAMYELGSRQWNYLIPENQEDRLLLRGLCARTLAFENFYLSRYRAYLLTELQKDDVCKLFAVQQLRVVRFSDEECRMALRTVECGDNEVLREEVKETLQRLQDVQHER
jgi:hypothetical protein